MKQPRHRRMSWMRDPEVYRIHMQADFVREGDDQPICETDRFSFMANYVPRWKLKGPLRARLPLWLLEQADEWANAGAAVETSLERIDLLDQESMDRGWPEKKARFTRTTPSNRGSKCVPTPPSSSDSPMGSFSEGPAAKKPVLPSLQTDVVKANMEGPVSAHALSSPPWTPDSSLPVIEEGTAVTESAQPLDTDKLNQRLANVELVDKASAPTKTSPVEAPFDRPSWERFLEEYRREMEGIQEEDIVRFRHFRRRTDMDLAMLLDEYPHAVDKEILAEWRKWWQSMLPMQRKLEHKVAMVEMPRLYDIKHLRKVYGMRTD